VPSTGLYTINGEGFGCEALQSDVGTAIFNLSDTAQWNFTSNPSESNRGENATVFSPYPVISSNSGVWVELSRESSSV